MLLQIAEGKFVGSSHRKSVHQKDMDLLNRLQIVDERTRIVTGSVFALEIPFAFETLHPWIPEPSPSGGPFINRYLPAGLWIDPWF